MSELYDRDIAAWATEQAQALRARSANRLDWDNLAEEIEDVGRSETEAVMSLLTLIMGHKLRLIGWPGHIAADHWRAEIRASLARVAKRYRASMHLEAELADMFRIARLDTDAHMLDQPAEAALPSACPWTLDELLTEAREQLKG